MGGVRSWKVTVVVQRPALPLGSVATRVTVTVVPSPPKGVPASGSCTKSSTVAPQLSLLSAAVIGGMTPLQSSSRTTSGTVGQTMTGRTVSRMATVNRQVSWLPLASVAVRTTVVSEGRRPAKAKPGAGAWARPIAPGAVQLSLVVACGR